MQCFSWQVSLDSTFPAWLIVQWAPNCCNTVCHHNLSCFFITIYIFIIHLAEHAGLSPNKISFPCKHILQIPLQRPHPKPRPPMAAVNCFSRLSKGFPFNCLCLQTGDGHGSILLQLCCDRFKWLCWHWWIKHTVLEGGVRGSREKSQKGWLCKPCHGWTAH